jgi:hypothetical protein
MPKSCATSPHHSILPMTETYIVATVPFSDIDCSALDGSKNNFKTLVVLLGLDGRASDNSGPSVVVALRRSVTEIEIVVFGEIPFILVHILSD